MEAVIELALQRLNMRRDQAENELKYKRQLFERKLTKHAQMLNAFKKKDPPMLTLDEMKENVEIIEGIAEKIRVKFLITSLQSPLKYILFRKIKLKVII